MPLLAPPPEARFWGSGPEAGAWFRLFGAPLDLTGSGRLGTGEGPPAVRRASHNIESYSPRLDGDLFDAGLADLFKLFVAWEVYRQAFPRGSAAQSFAGALLVATLAGLAAFYFLGGAHDTNFFVAIGLNASFAVTIWILGVLALVQYYHIALSTNLWGIALGLGLFSASSIVNYSTLGLNQQALPVFGFIRGTSFLTGLLIWTSCLWSFRPAPALTAPPPPDAPPFPPPLEAGAAAVRRALRLKPGPAPDSKEN